MDQTQFEAWWPEVSRRLNATLTRRGVRPADAADIVQETAVRTLARWPDVDDCEAFTRWAHTVAWRQCIDAYRRTRGATTVSFGASHDQAAPEGWSSDRVVEGKLELERTFRAMASLSTADRAALVAAIAGPASTAIDRKQAVREAVRLHRARLRLVGVVTKLGGGVAVSWKGLRKLAQMEASRTAAAAIATIVFVSALSLPDEVETIDLQPSDEGVAVAITDPPPAPAAAPTPTAQAPAPAAARPTTTTTAPPPRTPAAAPDRPDGLDIVPPPPPPPRTRGRHNVGPAADIGWDTNGVDSLPESLTRGCTRGLNPNPEPCRMTGQLV